MIGVVLCGGQSTRMGSDKGLLKLGDKTWAHISVEILNTFQLPAFVSVNKKQVEKYSAIFPKEILIIDDDSLQMPGPLGGILNVHLQYPKEDMLVLACDMPLMGSDLIKELLAKYNNEPVVNALIYTNDGELEPLPGIYRSTGLAHIHHLYLTHRLQRHSMKFMLEHIATCPIL
ncbi:MAG TPA: molybdenum cofactor guanylyltransferase, partial [Chitinophagaceae bacterium]|nr:molybdenum cofactor guanylyltransferase [Chitinophagaceae bacterium]